MSLNITENNNLKKLTLALDTAKYYNVPPDKAKDNVSRISAVVKQNWKNIAKRNGCTQIEIERMKNAFEDESIWKR